MAFVRFAPLLAILLLASLACGGAGAPAAPSDAGDLPGDRSAADGGGERDAGTTPADAPDGGGSQRPDAGAASEDGGAPDVGTGFPRPDTSAVDAADPDPAPGAAWARDWAADPSVAQLDAPGALYALSDIHGGYERAAVLLKAAGLLTGLHTGALRWTGGNATLVVVGDHIDKGPRSVDTLDLLRILGYLAPRSGGRVVPLLGNHEAELLVDPQNSKADALRAELPALGVTATAFVSATQRWGRFLRRLPVAALVSGWFFAHAGDPGGRSATRIGADFRAAVDAGRWSDASIVGGTSILEARDWWSSNALSLDLAALPARHVVMGHEPNAFSVRGAFRAHFAGRLLAIDVGMSPAVDDSPGLLLRIDAPSGQSQAFAVDPAGHATPLDLSAP